MKLSVIVPGFRTPLAMWRRCIDSVAAALPEGDGEIICVDDGDAGQWALDEEARAKSVVRVLHRRNGGLSVARNTGLGYCRGEVVTFVDSDDEVTREVYAKALSQLERTRADIVLFGVKTIWVSEGLMKVDSLKDCDYGKPTIEDVLAIRTARLLNYACNKVYRLDFLNKQRLRFEPKGMPCEDAIFTLDCLLAGARIAASSVVGYIYYRTGGTLLSHYKSTLAAGLRKERDRWNKFLGHSLLVQEIVLAEWENLWMPGSPFSWGERVVWARERRASLLCVLPRWQRQLLRLSPTLLALGRGLFAFVRQRFYLRPIRRYHILRRYPTAQNWVP